MFELGKAKLNKRQGTARLPVTVPGPGTLTLGGKGVVEQRPEAGFPPGAVAKTVDQAGTVKLKVKAKGKRKRRLNNTGKVKMKMKITFTPSDGTGGTQTKKLKLKKKQPR